MRKAQVDNKQGLQGITGKFIDRYFHPGFGKQPSSTNSEFHAGCTVSRYSRVEINISGKF